MNVQGYLKRIHFTGDIYPSPEVLKELQKHHLLHIPFENLDIHYGIPIKLDTVQFYTKIITQKRGGFCYELNGLFHELLVQCGFHSTLISGRVYNSKTDRFGEEFDHLALLVSFDEQEYLVDVGFGEFAFHPLLIETDVVQHDPRGNFILEKTGDEYTVSTVNGDSRNIEYKFSKKSRSLQEFQGMCQYHQTSPDSHFTQKKLITRPSDTGRITLTAHTLILTEDQLTRKIVKFSGEDYATHLAEWFGIEESNLQAQFISQP
jgi:N-hydroxyarylamine O-acetyltransferase